ncbi:hypothetical protein EC844_12639 [Acinetobacter calcoaceticus]|uniref:Uncharacterized protein n=1 Tax=Acinetobacter calcoaceticus TaxID=471 RepID=A0A4R1XJQ3_ACICA|nr:hypothetical protein EC844_12639 [Acinetobacter calcoaceticus]
MFLFFQLLVGCAKKDLNEIQTEASYVQKSYAASDLAAELSIVQFTNILKNIYPTLKITYPKDVSIVTLLPSDIKPDARFSKFNNWFSIKITRSANSDQWGSSMVEIYNQESYEATKDLALSHCKNIWGHIDNRVPPVIDELADLVKDQEKNGSDAMIQLIRYGYSFELDARRYKDGYPVVCMVATNTK